MGNGSSRGAGVADASAEQGVADDTDPLPTLIAGVAAAPPGHPPDAWAQLLPAGVTAEELPRLAERIGTLRQFYQLDRPDPQARLAALRRELRRRRLTGFIVPRGDEHQGEYVAARAERLQWLSGFTGSAGTAVVLADLAVLFVDGRYTVQARAEVDDRWFEVKHSTREPLTEWLARTLPPRARLGYDGWLHTPSQVVAIERACRQAEARAVAVGSNPVDRIWHDRPPPPIAPVFPHAAKYAGEASEGKRRRLADSLLAERQDAAFLAQPDGIAWLLNVRGGDLPYAPVPLAFALLAADARVQLFIDGRKLTDATCQYLGPDVDVLPPDRLPAALDQLGARRACVRIDPEGTPSWVDRRLRAAGALVVEATDPCRLPKALKSEIELAGIRAAHVRDGVALSRFLAWLAAAAGSGTVGEIAAAEHLAAFRGDGALYRGASFPTISAAGSNGAIVHYRATPASEQVLQPGTLYLVDSGGQYLDGTTDVTRTIAVGVPTDEMRERYTLVLKGHIALASARFPRGTTGSQLDALARMALWHAGLDYDHGTGHGVGHFLNVHEGPQRISKLPSRIPLQPGMVISNEPGYYKTGAYGIRIENLVAVTQAGRPDGGEQEMLGFETLTLAPLDRMLIVRDRLADDEVAWLNAYHARVRATLAPLLDAATRRWLEQATAPI